MMAGKILQRIELLDLLAKARGAAEAIMSARPGEMRNYAEGMNRLDDLGAHRLRRDPSGQGKRRLAAANAINAAQKPDVLIQPRSATCDRSSASRRLRSSVVKAGKHKGKGAVEAGVRHLQRYIARKLKHGVPRSLAEMDAIVQEAVTAINKRVMRALKTSRLKRFEQKEPHALPPLPGRPYEYGGWVVGRKVPAGYHFHHDKVAYSVPFELIGRGINMKITSNKIEIFYDSKLVAIHLKPTNGQERVTNPDHMPKAHRAIHQKDSNALIARAATHSQSFGGFIAGHLQQHKNLPSIFAMLEKLIKLRDAYGSELFDKACFAAVRRKQFASAVLQELLVVGSRKPRKVNRLAPFPEAFREHSGSSLL